MKYKALFKKRDGNVVVIKVCDNREDAINACLDYNDNYCLDSRQERYESLKIRDFYVCGCGPDELSIEEVVEQ